MEKSISIPLKASDIKGSYSGPKDIKSIAIKKGTIRLSGDGVFYTIQGEGPTIGLPALFIRLHHCNLACTWCLAAGTKVCMAEGSYRNIENIIPGEYILASDGTSSMVQRTSTVEKTEYYEIELVDGTTIKCSDSHEFWVKNRWIKAEDLVPGAKLTTTPDSSMVIPHGQRRDSTLSRV